MKEAFLTPFYPTGGGNPSKICSFEDMDSAPIHRSSPLKVDRKILTLKVLLSFPMVLMRAFPKKRDVMAHYDTLGGRIYDLRYGHEQTAKYDVIFSRWSIDTADLVLDVGCGTGLLLSKIKAFSIGVDISIILLRRARKRVRRGLGLVQCDAEHLPFRDGVFNKILAVTVIQNIPRPENFLLEIKRVSKMGSDIVISILKKLEFERFRDLIESSGLSIKSSFEDEEVEDWIIFASNG